MRLNDLWAVQEFNKEKYYLCKAIINFQNCYLNKIFLTVSALFLKESFILKIPLDISLILAYNKLKCNLNIGN